MPERSSRLPVKLSLYGLLILDVVNAYAATPTIQGQSGYINMPSAWVEADGTTSLGIGHDQPYTPVWLSATLLPFLQMVARYESISGIPGFTNVSGAYGSNYGRYKDKQVGLKLRLFDETDSLPALSFGSNDIQGTRLFKGEYLVASKSFGTAHNVEASVGYGRTRPNGLFAGMRWAPIATPRWAVVAEYDATDYQHDFRATETGADRRRKGPAIGLEYRWGWLGAQVARQRDHFSFNTYLSIPFAEREFVPKLYEPAPFNPKDAPARVSVDEWKNDGTHGTELVQALVKQDFRNVRVGLDATTLRLVLTNNRISNMGRAVGRAVRTALAFAPQGTEKIEVTYTKLEQPIATYEFRDLQRLSDYLTGLADRNAFLQTVEVRYAQPSDRIGDDLGLLAAVRDQEEGLSMQVGREGSLVQVASEDKEANRFKLVPKMSFFFNDPSGFLRYEFWGDAIYDRRLAEGLYLNSDMKLTVLQDVTAVTQPSNSLLPHVRTDIADYKRGGRVKLNRLLLNKYAMLDERVYARGSAGLYEEMFRGVGGQVLYLPKDSRWATDLTADALQQRGFKGWFDKRDYQTVSALAAIHYKLPYDVTATARVGRFLAKDDGVRLEFKRRFQSGVEIGAWYSRTNGKDITNPGTPDKPYNDKGVFLSVPLNIMLPADSQNTASVALSPWTRDVGQMVASPGDLYDMMEQPRRDMTAYDGLGNFAERRDEQNLPSVNPPVRPMTNPWPEFRWRLEQSVSTTPTLPQSVKGTMLGAGAILASALLDKPVDHFMKRHANSSFMRDWSKLGNASPVLFAGAAGAALLFGDARAENAGIVALESMAAAGAVSIATKRVVGRARPDEELGPFSKTHNRSDASFPSNHSTLAFAAITPLAQEYNAPWLYGVAAIGTLGRTADRQHWVSDVVAGGVLGYAVGGWLWHAQSQDRRSSFAVSPGPRSIEMAWRGSY